MINKNRRYRTFNKPKYGQHFSRPRRQSSLLGDPNLFIKKSLESTQDAYVSENSFESFNLSTVLKVNIINKGYSTPTPIQDQAILPIIEGKDLIGLAATGTGKTGAFLIPIIQKIYATRDRRALIIVPTRELALQIQEEFRSLSENMKLYASVIIGGANMNRQIHEVRRNPHVVIATPGRLRDLVERRAIYLEDYSIVVLDEVDLMVDIGFIKDVKYFVSLMPDKRQSLFFSATISSKVREVLQSFVKEPVTVSVKKEETSSNVDQDVIKVGHPSQKLDKLHDLLIQDGFDKVLIFGRTKHGVDKLERELSYRGFKTGAIHGNKKLGQRKRVLESFKQNEIQVLLATDVASRGLDIDNVTHVINYDLPETYEDYIHRIGRTGRANRKGVALTFVD